jgi:hypothetical protein
MKLSHPKPNAEGATALDVLHMYISELLKLRESVFLLPTNSLNYFDP